MLFNSLPFLLVFFPASFCLFALLPHRESVRCWYLIGVSLVFYGYWDIRLVPLLLLSVIGNWLAVELFRTFNRRGILIAAIAANLLVLCHYKYAGFFLSSLNEALGTHFEGDSILLPLGISFFTFHHIIYLADLLRGASSFYRFRDYALYIVFFPQILAGPLVRHREFVPQICLDPWRNGLGERLSRGAVLFIIGLIKKIFIADTLAAIATPLFSASNSGQLSFAEGWSAALAFTFQIYFDFSGYSDMAIGLALIFGFTLPMNFDAPYRALSLQDFWRRWHMTLSRFLRDYLYIPLGGNRHGLTRQMGALLATMTLGGLWHGAGWTFILWGLWHGAGLAAGVLSRRRRIALPTILAWPATFLFVVIGWVFFRAKDFSSAWTILAAMSDWRHFALPDQLAIFLVAGAVAIAGPTSQVLALQRLQPRTWAALTGAVSVLLVLLKLGDGPGYEFIYFRF